MKPSVLRASLGVVLLTCSTLIAAAAGAVIAGMLQRGGMGWDEIANGLLGMLAGGAVGIVVAVLCIRRLTLPALRDMVLVAVLLATSLVLFGVYRMRTEREPAAPMGPPTTPRTPTSVPTPLDD